MNKMLPISWQSFKNTSQAYLPTSHLSKTTLMLRYQVSLWISYRIKIIIGLKLM